MPNGTKQKPISISELARRRRQGREDTPQGENQQTQPARTEQPARETTSQPTRQETGQQRPGALSIDEFTRRKKRIQRQEERTEQAQAREEEDDSLFENVAEFIAPTTTATFEKLQEGEDIGFRDVAGSALEIGSFLVPAGAIGRAVGIGGRLAARGASRLGLGTAQKAATKGASTLGRQAAEGAAVGAASGGLFGAGQEVAQEGTGVGDVLGGAAEHAVLGAPLGAAVPVAARGVSRGAQAFRGRGARRAEQVEKLGRGEPEASLATKKLEDGRIVTDKPAREAVRQGIDEGDVSLIKNATPQDKSKMKRMLDIRKKQLENKRTTARATDVVGESFLDQAQFLAKRNKQAAQELDQVAQNLAGKRVDVQDALRSFGDDLQAAGVKIDRRGRINFTDSDFEGIPSAQKAIKNALTRARRVARTGDAMQAHRMKRFIDETVEYGKKTEGLSGRAQRLLKGLRRNIDQNLDTQFPEYNRVNQIFSTTRKELNKVNRMMGKGFDTEEILKEARAGTILRSLFSNTQRRDALIPLLESVDSTAKNLGMKADDNIADLASFADTLEGLIGSEAPSSFLGQVERGVQGAQEVGEIAEGLTRGGLVGGATKAAGTAIRAARGINKKNQIKALDELLGDVKPASSRTNFGKK